MFVENYRLDTMIGGQAQTVIPYPKISEEDWHIWKAFLPVKSAPFRQESIASRDKEPSSNRLWYSIRGLL